ncbi:MAG: ATP-binding protein [Deltaproteobacteria bacterium]|nr:ATP-binding protein [Deltaproteobacteria bacterium]
MIKRDTLTREVLRRLKANPVVAILGPRQCGKTTLARQVAAERQAHYFDLEDAADAAHLTSPRAALASLRGLVILDEIQRRPEIFETLRVLADRPKTPARFLILGSASPGLMRGASETLAGRVAFVEMGGFDLGEVGVANLRRLWRRGSFPRSFLAQSEAESQRWREDFIRTFLERDMPQLGVSVPAATLRRFWTMTAHYHGQIWNAAEFARSLGSSEGTARNYLDLLTGALVLRPLLPWFENIAKRQVKSPKIYIRDSGLLHALLSIGTDRDLGRHPKLGASWEGLAIEQVLSALKPRDAYFWATHGGAELDLFLLKDGRRLGFECKHADAPQMTKSMHMALTDLSLDKLWVLYPGEKRYALHERVEVLPLARVGELA